MIRINLTPYEELENPLWWVPDAIFVATIAICAYIASQFVLDIDRREIESINAQVVTVEKSVASLSKDVAAFKKLQKENGQLMETLNSLLSITESKVDRYRPVIVAEHLQNLRPEGVWFQSITYGTPPIRRRDAKSGTSTFVPGKLTIVGFAFDNILVAEFLAALRATQMQDVDVTDIRTNIYFNKIQLNASSLVKRSGPLFNVVKEEDELDDLGIRKRTDIPRFSLQLEYTIRESQEALKISFNTDKNTMFDRFVEVL